VVSEQTGRPRLEVADIVRLHGDEYRRAHHPSAPQEAVLRHIEDCRTPVLGGHLDACPDCGHERPSYNSCRDRHCPKCQAIARNDWLDARRERLLPVPYFHVVFTIPDDLNPLALGNKRLVFDILFAAAAETLKTIAIDPKHLGAEPGFTAILHTWGSNLHFHPHLHCVVTGGGLSTDGTRWAHCRPNFFLPVKVLGKLFRGKFLAALQKARAAGKLHFGGSTASLADEYAWNTFRDGLYKKAWVVYAKPPFGGPEHVFAYLGRYTHRVAIANSRLVALDNGRITFTYKDYSRSLMVDPGSGRGWRRPSGGRAAGGMQKTMTLTAVEFLRRFLLHVLPQGFTRIRHFGLLASSNVNSKLERARTLLEHEGRRLPPIPKTDPDALWHERLLQRTGIDVMACPRCGGRLVRSRSLAPVVKSSPPDTS